MITEYGKYLAGLDKQASIEKTAKKIGNLGAPYGNFPQYVVSVQSEAGESHHEIHVSITKVDSGAKGYSHRYFPVTGKFIPCTNTKERNSLNRKLKDAVLKFCLANRITIIEEFTKNVEGRVSPEKRIDYKSQQFATSYIN